jgi:hypothetical protein
MDNEVKNFKMDLYRLCWYMRGSVQLEDVMVMSSEDREIIGKIIKENLDTAKKTGLPFF